MLALLTLVGCRIGVTHYAVISLRTVSDGRGFKLGDYNYTLLDVVTHILLNNQKILSRTSLEGLK